MDIKKLDTKSKFQLLIEILNSLTLQELYEFWYHNSSLKHKVYNSMGYY